MAAVDLTGTANTVVVPAERQKLRCPISAALPPVHILQALDPSFCGELGSEMQIRNHRHRITHNPAVTAQEPSCAASGSECLASLLQTEDHISRGLRGRQEFVDAGIASRTALMQGDVLGPGTSVVSLEGQKAHASSGGSNTEAAPANLSRHHCYMHQLMLSTRHDQSQRGPTAERAWHKSLEDMSERAHCAASEQLPWTHKYAPVNAHQVLANADASRELLMWLKQVEPIEAALTSLRSGHMYALHHSLVELHRCTVFSC